MSGVVVQGNAASLPLADASVDLIATSPPYFALRSYQDGGEHYAGQIGSESTPAEFVAALLACTREWMRVLKPSGSIWVNLGDKYSGAQQQNSGRQSSESSSDYWKKTNPAVTGIRAKSLMGFPWRYALGCIDELGLILRANVIWSKPNGLPESVTDRVRRSHEDWFHFTKSPRYFAAVDEIREPHTGNAHSSGAGQSRRWVTSNAGGNHRALDTDPTEYNPLGKLPGSVWTIPSEPLTVPDHLGIDHFAAFPTEWPRRIIQGWSPTGICTRCGEPRLPKVDISYEANGSSTSGMKRDDKEPFGRLNGTGMFGGKPVLNKLVTIAGYACACPTADAPTRRSVVLDPFGGTGTTALCASVLGRIGISVDLSHDYSRLAQWRTQDPASRAKAMRVEKPPVQLDGQADLFGASA